MDEPFPTSPLQTAQFHCDNCLKVSMFIVGRTPRCYFCHSTDGALKPEHTKPESTEGVGLVSVLKRQEGAPLNLG